MSTKAEVTICPVCGEAQQNILLVASNTNGASKSAKFVRNRVKVCKCNEKEVYA